MKFAQFDPKTLETLPIGKAFALHTYFAALYIAYDGLRNGMREQNKRYEDIGRRPTKRPLELSAVKQRFRSPSIPRFSILTTTEDKDERGMNQERS